MTMLASIGRVALTYVREMGRMLIFLLSSFGWLVRPPFRFIQFVKQLHFIGYKSTFVVVLTAGFTGMVLALQGYYTLRKFGSEGLLGVVTEVTVRILKKPSTARAVLIGFPSNEDAGDCVAAIIAAGIIPAGLEMLDQPAARAVEEFAHSGYDLDAAAILLAAAACVAAAQAPRTVWDGVYTEAQAKRKKALAKMGKEINRFFTLKCRHGCF